MNTDVPPGGSAFIEALNRLTTRQQFDFALWCGVRMSHLPKVDYGRRLSPFEEAASAAVWGVGDMLDGSVNVTEADAFFDPSYPEMGGWSASRLEATVAALATAIEQHDEPALRDLKPALDWLLLAAARPPTTLTGWPSEYS